jgi:4'-phosphopantetheinyl transferase EntD
LARRIAWGAKESIFKAADQKGLSFSKDIQLKFIATKIEGKGALLIFQMEDNMLFIGA